MVDEVLKPRRSSGVEATVQVWISMDIRPRTLTKRHTPATAAQRAATAQSGSCCDTMPLHCTAFT
jgi:hypothetical protein